MRQTSDMAIPCLKAPFNENEGGLTWSAKRIGHEMSKQHELETWEFVVYHLTVYLSASLSRLDTFGRMQTLSPYSTLTGTLRPAKSAFKSTMLM